MKVITRIALGLGLAAGLGGCQTLERIVRPEPVATSSVPTYCYRTLGKVDCYTQQQPHDTLVGVDVPPPRAQPVKAGPSDAESSDAEQNVKPAAVPPSEQPLPVPSGPPVYGYQPAPVVETAPPRN